ncbi:hypothetical protein EVAR_25331_1 [Eumeta japonica]|uniref:Uncharacterized protein n=1 Tax=Eumeta variegata TaxID=151549 RepID=A0A4C1VQ57_EUMVA|nr:hypothetical protein EVAR_25331_1 [Eumeta japonica]
MWTYKKTTYRTDNTTFGVSRTSIFAYHDEQWILHEKREAGFGRRRRAAGGRGAGAARASLQRNLWAARDDCSARKQLLTLINRAQFAVRPPLNNIDSDRGALAARFVISYEISFARERAPPVGAYETFFYFFLSTIL